MKATRLSKTRNRFATSPAAYTPTGCRMSYGRTVWTKCGLRASTPFKCKRPTFLEHTFLNVLIKIKRSYIFWNEHEPFPGVYDFEGQQNITHFIELAHEIGFNVLLRAGPYACAEHEYGGLPWWLLSNGIDTVRPRTSEETFMNAVRRWFQVLLPKLSPYLYINGGPVLTVQVCS